MFSYESLNREERVLLRQALDHLEAGYDPASHLVWETLEDKPFRSVRASLYYALGLLMTRGREAVPAASDLIGAVLALQFTDPGAIEYGTFRHPDEAPPPRALFDWRDVTPLSRYMADVTFEHIEAGLYARLLSSPALSAHAGEVRRLLRASVNACVPVCWDTYEPNLREFAGMVLAMLLHHFSDILPGELRERILRSGLSAVYEGDEAIWLEESYARNDPLIEGMRAYAMRMGIGRVAHTGDPAFAFVKIFIVEREEARVRRLLEALDGRLEGIRRRDTGSGWELVPAGFSKGTGIDVIRERLGVPPEDCYVIGDSANDLSMLEHVPNSIAMGNAEEDVKRICAYVTAAAGDGGIARALAHYGLSGGT